MSDTTNAVATNLFAAIERRDLAAVRDLYAPQVEIWHNVTRRTQTRAENLELLTLFTGRVDGLRYEILARDFFPGGFVQRHVLRGVLATGAPLEVHACLVVYVSEGRIERLFEYLDAANVRGVFA